MVEKIETLLLLLGLVGILAVVAERLRFPFPILLVIAGLGIGLTPRLPDVHLNPEIILLIVLPPLLFSAAWNFPWEDFRANLIPIFGLAVGLVFVTMTAVAWTAVWLIPGMTLAAGFVLGAIVSPPDAVAANAVLKNLRIPRRLSTVLEGESLVNDSSSLVAYQFAVAAVVTGTFSMAEAAGDFVWMSAGGILYGWAVGMGAERLHRRLRDPAVQITLTILTPYAAYLPAEKLGFSGVLATVAAGLHVGHRSWTALTPESRLGREAIWRFIDYFLNGLVFILIGLQFPTIVHELQGPPLWQLVLIGAAISAVVVLVRFAWILPMSGVERFFFRRSMGQKDFLNLGGLIVGSWAGMRGVVSLAAALAVPTLAADGAAFPHRNVILFLTFCVIFTTLVLQGLSLPWLVRKLKVEAPEHDYDREIEARLELLTGLLGEIDRQLQATEDAYERESLGIWKEHYEERRKRIEQRAATHHNYGRASLVREKTIFPHLMNHVRLQLKELRRQGRISEEIRRRIEYDLDVEEQRLQRFILR